GNHTLNPAATDDGAPGNGPFNHGCLSQNQGIVNCDFSFKITIHPHCAFELSFALKLNAFPQKRIEFLPEPVFFLFVFFTPHASILLSSPCSAPSTASRSLLPPCSHPAALTVLNFI